MSGRCRLYLVTPNRFDTETFTAELRKALAGGDVASLQLRMKEAGEEELRTAARALMPICDAAKVAFIINDRPGLAAELGAEGVHLGPDDMDIAEARKIVGFDAVIGYSAKNSSHAAFTAGDAGADYVAFGAFYASPTKETDIRADLELLEGWAEIIEIPSVAIGGITLSNAEPIVRAGADFIAVSSAVWTHPDGPKAAVTAFNELFERLAEKH